jgi:hypothetical protein
MGKGSANVGEACRKCHTPFLSRHCMGCTKHGHRVIFCPTCAWEAGEPHGPEATQPNRPPVSSTHQDFFIPSRTTGPSADQSWPSASRADVEVGPGIQRLADHEATPNVPSTTDTPMQQAAGSAQSQYADVQLPDGTACCTRCNWRGITKSTTCLA